MANSRNYSVTAVSTTLNGSITNVGVSVILNAQTGMPTPPFLLSIEPDTANEEIVLVTSGAGTGGSPYIVTRGQDGTSAIAHNNAVTVQHRISAIDLTDSRTHEATQAGVHLLTSSMFVSGCTAGLTTNTTVSNTASETTMAKSHSVPGNFAKAGSCYAVVAWGTFACTLTPTLTIRLKYGGTILASNILTFGSGLSSDFVYLGFINFQTVGASGSLSGSQTLSVTTASFTAGVSMPQDTQGMQTSISTTGAASITATAQWSAASGSNTVTTLGSFVQELY